MNKFFKTIIPSVAMLTFGVLTGQAQTAQFAGGQTEFEAPVTQLEVVWEGSEVTLPNGNPIMVSTVKAPENPDLKDVSVTINGSNDGIIIPVNISEPGNYILTIGRNYVYINGSRPSGDTTLNFTVTSDDNGGGTDPNPDASAQDPQFVGGDTFEAGVSSFEITFGSEAVLKEVEETGFYDVSVVDAQGKNVFDMGMLSVNTDNNTLEVTFFSFNDEGLEVGSYTLKIGATNSITINDQPLQAFSLAFEVISNQTTTVPEAQFANNVSTFEPPVTTLEVVWPGATLGGTAGQVQATVYDSSNEEIYCKNPAFNNTDGLTITLRTAIEDEGSYKLVLICGNDITVNGQTVGTVTLPFTVEAAPAQAPEPQFVNGISTFQAPLKQLEVVWEGATVNAMGGTAVVNLVGASTVEDACKIAKNSTGNGIIVTFRTITEITEAGSYNLVITGSNDITVNGEGIGTVTLPFTVEAAPAPAPEPQFADGKTEYEAPVSELEVVWPGAKITFPRDNPIMVSVVLSSEPVDMKDVTVTLNNSGDGIIIPVNLTEAGTYTLTINKNYIEINGSTPASAISLDFTVTADSGSTDQNPELPEATLVWGEEGAVAPVSTLEVVWENATVTLDEAQSMMLILAISINDGEGYMSDYTVDNVALNDKEDGLVLTLTDPIDAAGTYSLVIDSNDIVTVNGQEMPAIDLSFTVTDDDEEDPIPPVTELPEPKFAGGQTSFQAPLSSLEVVWDDATVVVNGGTAVVADAAGKEVVSNCKIEANTGINGIVITFRDGAITTAGSYKLIITGGDDITVNSQGIGTVEMTFNVTGGWSGIEGIEADSQGMFRIYNLNGVNVLNSDNANSVRTLPAGVYVINGKKVVIK